MKYLISLLVLAAFILPISCQSCTRWKRQINLDVDISGIVVEDKLRPGQLTDIDIKLLKDYAELLRQQDGHSFDQMGGEPELMRRARRGDINIDAVKEILKLETKAEDHTDLDNTISCKEGDKLAVDLRILYPAVYNYIIRQARV